MINRKMRVGEKVDHINGNTLDCRRDNLRLATHQQNIRNSKLSTSNKTGYKGVWINRGKIVASITVNYKHVVLGSFDTLLDAAIAYNYAAVENFGDFARLNPIEGWESLTPKKAIRKKRTNYKSKPYLIRIRFQGKRWAVIVKRDSKEQSIGLFDTKEEALMIENAYKAEHVS